MHEGLLTHNKTALYLKLGCTHHDDITRNTIHTLILVYVFVDSIKNYRRFS